MTPTPTPTPVLPSVEGLKVVAYLVGGLPSGEPSLCFDDERGDYGDEEHTPVFEALVRLSDAEAALSAQAAEKDAEIQRLRAEVATTRATALSEAHELVWQFARTLKRAAERGAVMLAADEIRATAIDQARGAVQLGGEAE